MTYPEAREVLGSQAGPVRGWPLSLPPGWQLAKLKTVASIAASNVDKKSEDGEERVALCNYTDVYYNDFIRSDLDFMQATASAREIRRFALQGGEVLLTKDSETAEDIAVPAFVPETLEGVVCGYHLYLLRPKEDRLDGRYLFRACSVPAVHDQFVMGANGITRFGLGQEALGAALVPVPPLPTQRAIAAFLDRKTAEIDDLIAKKERLIELLDEQRTALITRAVTRGLDPGVEMKDSGVEWLGEVPAHWEIRPNGTLFLRRDERGYPDLPILNVSIHTGVTVREFSDQRIEQQSEDRSVYKRALIGDIAYNKMRMWQGAVGAVPKDGLVSPDYTVATPLKGVCSKYYELLFRTQAYKTEVDRHSYGMVKDRNRLYWLKFKQMGSPVPPVQEQESIVAWVEEASRDADRLRDKVKQAIDRLHEYRTALISAAVTGQIDIRDETP